MGMRAIPFFHIPRLRPPRNHPLPILLLLALLPALPPVLPAAAACPPPLPESAYATRCTGGEVTLFERGAPVVYRDCAKGERHTRAMAKEIVALVEKLRCRFGERVVVTSGYRSWRHNLYSWAVLAAEKGSGNEVSRKSKHMEGKAVDFHVRGLSYLQHKELSGQLRRWAGLLERPLRGSRQAIWSRVYRPEEGRDPDNRHGFPYIHVELRR